MRALSSLGAISGLAMIGAVMACAESSDYAYTPDTANATAAGLPAARTPIPQEQPQGAIEVVSYGITDLHRDAAKIPALHVRAIVTNDGDDMPWTLDTSQQLVQIPGEGQSRAMFVNADVDTLPSTMIGKHERRVIDFYFPVPDALRDGSHLERFDFLWQVHTAARTVAARTEFSRVEKEPAVAYEMVAAPWPLWAGWGPYWWYDPFYPSAGFVGVHPHVFHGPGHMTVGRFGGHFRAGGTGHVARHR